MDTATPGTDPGSTKVSVILPGDEYGELRRRAEEEVLPMTQHLRRLIRADARANPPSEADALRRAGASEIAERVR